MSFQISKDPLKLNSGRSPKNSSKTKKVNLLATIASEAASKELLKLVNSPVQKIQSPAKAKKKEDAIRNDEKENVPQTNNSPLKVTFKNIVISQRRLSHMPSLSSLLPKRQKSEKSLLTPTKVEYIMMKNTLDIPSKIVWCTFGKSHGKTTANILFNNSCYHFESNRILNDIW